MTYKFMPKTFSVRDVQRKYREVFDEAKKNSPVVILSNNLPDVAIVNLDYLEDLITKASKTELEDAVNLYKKEKKTGTLKELNSVKELM